MSLTAIPHERNGATPSPATLPGAGVPHLDAAIRRADGETSAALPATVTAALDRAAEIRHAAEHEAARITAASAAPFDAALTDEPAPIPTPPFAWTPGVARQPNPMARDQYVRRAGLELAVRFYAADPDVDDGTVLETAKEWAEWIRTGL